MNTIRVECQGSHNLNWRTFKVLQGDLKSLSKDNYERFKKVILKYGYSSPFHVWNHEGSYYILDGTQRYRTLTEMDKEGYDVPDELPAVMIIAKDEKEARSKLAALASQYGRVEREGLYEYMTRSGLTMEETEAHYSFPEVKFEDFKKEFFDVEDPENEVEINEKEIDENINTQQECPSCGYKW